ncbi:MAG: hypothetical protein ACI957_004811, partial [Verrucomicrobiales bacterium]
EREIEIEIFPKFEIERAVITPGLAWRSGGDRPWQADLFAGNDGNGSIYTNRLLDNELSWFETTVTAPGEISFVWDISSEECGDRLALLIDGNQINDIGGRVAWEPFSAQVPEGRHILRWQYSKGGSVADGSVADGSDRARVDEIQWIPETTGDPGTSFASWISTYNFPEAALQSDSADPDNDGLPNIVEFAFDLDPTIAQPLPLTWTQIDPTSIIVVIGPRSTVRLCKL